MDQQQFGDCSGIAPKYILIDIGEEVSDLLMVVEQEHFPFCDTDVLLSMLLDVVLSTTETDVFYNTAHEIAFSDLLYSRSELTDSEKDFLLHHIYHTFLGLLSLIEVMGFTKEKTFSYQYRKSYGYGQIVLERKV